MYSWNVPVLGMALVTGLILGLFRLRCWWCERKRSRRETDALKRAAQRWGRAE